MSVDLAEIEAKLWVRVARDRGIGLWVRSGVTSDSMPLQMHPIWKMKHWGMSQRHSLFYMLWQGHALSLPQNLGRLHKRQERDHVSLGLMASWAV